MKSPTNLEVHLYRPDVSTAVEMCTEILDKVKDDFTLHVVQLFPKHLKAKLEEEKRVSRGYTYPDVTADFFTEPLVADLPPVPSCFIPSQGRPSSPLPEMVIGNETNVKASPASILRVKK